MTKIHVNRDRQNLGQFSAEEVATGLANGRFLSTDLAWREGMETWLPLAAFTDLPVAPAEDIAEASPVLAPGSPEDDLTKLSAPLAPTWERDPTAPLFTRIYETVREVLGSPAATFAGMPQTGGLGRPLVFLLLLQSVGSIIMLAYQMGIQMLVPKTVDPNVTPALLALGFGFLVIMVPAFVALGSFINAGIFHLCLMLVGGARKPFEATYRTVCYATGATSVLLLIPFCGAYVQGIWNLVLLVIGFREVHGISTGKSVIAVLLPVMVCCGLGILGIVTFGGALMAYAAQASH